MSTSESQLDGHDPKYIGIRPYRLKTQGEVDYIDGRWMFARTVIEFIELRPAFPDVNRLHRGPDGFMTVFASSMATLDWDVRRISDAVMAKIETAPTKDLIAQLKLSKDPTQHHLNLKELLKHNIIDKDLFISTIDLHEEENEKQRLDNEDMS